MRCQVRCKMIINGAEGSILEENWCNQFKMVSQNLSAETEETLVRSHSGNSDVSSRFLYKAEFLIILSLFARFTHT